jgi:hypothetical protein
MMVSTLVLKKLTAASGLYFGIFLIMHFVNHYSLYFGLDYATNNMILFRKVYQNPIFEIGLVLSLLTHYVSNTMIYLHRTKIEKSGKLKKDDTTSTKKDHTSHGEIELMAHRYTGYFLSLSVIGHILATRILPIIALPDPKEYDYTFLTYAQKKLFGPLFGMYLVLFGIAGGWHLLYGTRSAIVTLFFGSSVTGKPFPIYLKPLAAINHILIINALVTLGGVYYMIDIETKKELHEKLYSYLPV